MGSVAVGVVAALEDLKNQVGVNCHGEHLSMRLLGVKNDLTTHLGQEGP